MKMYMTPNRCHIRIIGDESNQIFYFDHLDGLYSYCLDKDQNVVHLHCGTEVEVVRVKTNE